MTKKEHKTDKVDKKRL